MRTMRAGKSPATQPSKPSSPVEASSSGVADKEGENARSQNPEQHCGGSTSGAGEHSNGDLSIEQRETLLEDHPVMRGQYTVPTPMLIDAHEEARDRVWSRRTGVVFYGETRAGKTTCAKSIRDDLRAEFAGVFVTMASARRSLRPKQGHVSRLILEGCNHVLASRTDPEALLRNVITDIKTMLANVNGDQFVLVMDEVNLLNEFDLTELLEIHNIFWMDGIKMTTISFGQPEVLDVISALHKTGQRQIIARFFRKPIPFCSCTSEETLAKVLHSLDDDTEWPEGSGWTYTYFFFPRAFRNGFRLATFAGAIWRALVKALPEQSPSFTMEAIALTINGLYIGMKNRDISNLILSDEDIENALASADL
ncbi:ATP-binding protein [Paraburkholderia sp. BCC1884]|uniref:ATP-binding protein n=1 Tax=Paraburkholderia sp. BCC1884 TaxID=2562668 RepID=UPI0011828A79|nr:ATP-binding protein [Paraburkholderia sp. BCC1884]